MPSDQDSRAEALVERQKSMRETIPLVEKSERMRAAECAAKGGNEYSGGVCYK